MPTTPNVTSPASITPSPQWACRPTGCPCRRSRLPTTGPTRSGSMCGDGMTMATVRTKTFPVTWDELHRHARALAWRLLELGPWNAIIAVTRGGLVPAAIVARELDIRLVDTVCIASYDDRSQGA